MYSKFSSFPSVFSTSIIPPKKDASPALNCCTAELKLRKLPRFSDLAVPVIKAAAGTIRPFEVTNKRVDTANANKIGVGPKWVIMAIGTTFKLINMVKILTLPYLSVSRPTQGDVKTVKNPPAI